MTDFAATRAQFDLPENVVYLDGNSLGPLPRAARERLAHEVGDHWGRLLIRGWNEAGWIDLPDRVGDRIARLIGAPAGSVTAGDSTSVNLYKALTGALSLAGDRKVVLSDSGNFPTDLYVAQMALDALARGHELKVVEPEAVADAIDEGVAVLMLTEVDYRTGRLHDMQALTAKARDAGAITIWDLAHSAGALPVDLTAAGADFAIGCGYKYLNGGPGAPAFLYVRRDLQTALRQPIWGWLGAANPFTFDLDYTPAPNIGRFWVGTPPVLSLKAIAPAVELLLAAGIDRLRAKSMAQTEYLIFLADRWLTPLGFSVGSPRQADRRGSHVSLRHPEAYRINRALIEAEPPALRVIPDFREPDNLRCGVAPLYNSFTDIHRAMERLKTIVTERLYEAYSAERAAVT